MFTSWQLLSVASAYMALLFAVAWTADRRALRKPQLQPRPWTYALALAVYCTAWTFYGAVGRVADDGWSYLPIYLGPILVFVFGAPFLQRLIALCKSGRLTSVADFIGARYGNSATLAVAATGVALLAGVPYLALQLRGVSLGFDVLTIDSGVMIEDIQTVTIVTVLLAVFAMLFGTRHIASTESHQGMVLAVAFESLVKLLAFVAVGVFAMILLGGIAPSIDAVRTMPQLAPAQLLTVPFWMQTALAGAAVIVLPRQFHLMVVENIGPQELRTARWVFPMYLGIFALMVLPLAAAGALYVGGGAADRHVLALPLTQGQSGLAMLAFLGGFSAATGMVIVSAVALATMLSNEIILPLMLRGRGYQRASNDLGALLRRVRRITIAGLLFAAWLIDRTLYTQLPLAVIGLISFSAIAHLAPPVIAGVLWPRANRAGATAGLAGGMAAWAMSVLLPSLFPDLISFADPQHYVIQGAALSLGVHIALLAAISIASSPSLSEQVQSARLLGTRQTPDDRRGSGARVIDLLVLLERFFGADRTQAFTNEYAALKGKAPEARAVADAEFIDFCQSRLSSALGGASARTMIDRALRPAGGDVAEIIEQTSRAVRFNRELLHSTLDHMAQGVSVIDAELRLIAWNAAYQRLFDYPDELMRVGTPVSELIRFNVERGLLDSADIEDLVSKRVGHLQAGTAYRHERAMPGGEVVEITGNPMPGGGFVSTFSDVTDYKRAEAMLQSVNEELEARVTSRTQALAETEQRAQQARADAEQASRSKSRFLAATTHDLAQPLNAARLFAHALEDSREPQVQQGVRNLLRSLGAMESLLGGLSEYSRLDAGAQPVNRKAFAVQDLFDALGSEFTAMAEARGLGFHVRPCRLWIDSDPVLLRRIVQNLLANAVRYTRHGRVVLGCRRVGDAVRIEVHDTGPGIPQERQRAIFEEFRRFETADSHGGEQGLGLGLAISERMARLLRHPMRLRSQIGRGSVFSVTVATTDAATTPPSTLPTRPAPQRLEGLRLLVLDNDADTLQATAGLLRRWGCLPLPALNEAEARAQTLDAPPDAALIDYQLDHGENGIKALIRLRRVWGLAVPGILITGDATPEVRERARQLGLAFLAKPVKPAALRALLQQQRVTPQAAAHAPEDVQR